MCVCICKHIHVHLLQAAVCASIYFSTNNLNKPVHVETPKKKSLICLILCKQLGNYNTVYVVMYKNIYIYIYTVGSVLGQ